MNSEITIVWLRNDLRLEDNPALHHAHEYAKKNNSQISIIYILENFNLLSTDLGSASKWWLYKSLKIFNENFSKNFEIFNKYYFGIGAAISSFIFFFSLGYMSKFFSNYLKGEKIWKYINNFIIIFMSGLCIYILSDLYDYFI